MRVVTSLALFALGLPLAAGGMYLVVLGGSFYYVIAGALLLTAGVLAWRRHRAAIWIYLALTLGVGADQKYYDYECNSIEFSVFDTPEYVLCSISTDDCVSTRATRSSLCAVLRQASWAPLALRTH